MASPEEVVKTTATCFSIELSANKSDENPPSVEVTEAKSAKSVFCTLAICLGAFIASATVDYPSPAIPNLNNNPNPFHVDDDQISWIGSLGAVGALLGGLVGGQLMDAIGRKLALMTSAVLVTAVWVVVVSSSSLPCLLVGRVLTGLGTGVYTVTCAIYVGEIAPAPIRGLLGSCFMLASSFGSLYVYVLGAFLSWTWLAIAIAAANLVFVVALAVVPESPRWLLSVYRMKEAESALRWLRGDGSHLRRELNKLKEAALMQSRDKVRLSEFLQPVLLKPLLITVGLMLFHELCGSKVVNIYTVQIFQITKSSLDANMQTIVVGVMAIVGNLVCMLVSDCAGRKALLLVSGLIMALTMGGTGAFFYVLQVDVNYATGALTWLPMTCLMVFNFGYSVAFGPVPFLVMSELFPLRAKGVAGGIAMAFNWFMAFVMTKFFVNVTNAIHPYGGFWLIALFCALSVPFVVFCVPETKGKTLEELQNIFK